MPLPLEGIRILEMTMFGAAPYGAGHLCDMGAEIIKIEEPVGGDRMRGVFERAGLQTVAPAHAINYWLELGNRGKKSVGVDIRQEEGREIIYRLVPQCDALITSLRRKTLKKYRLDYETLSGLNPSLVYVHLSTFGAHGPDADLPGQDLTGMARGGMMNLMRPHPEADPLPMGIFTVGDMTASLQVAYATTMALLARERLGVGQEVNCSIMGAQLTVGNQLFQIYLTTRKDPALPERTAVKNPIRNIYRCADGKWLALGMTEGDRFWDEFCQVMERPDLATDPRFRDIYLRAEHSRELIAILDEVMVTRPRDEWCRRLKEHDCTAAPVQSYADLEHDPQVLANRWMVTYDHPTYGPMKQAGIMAELSKTPGRIGGPAPELGQHTEEVLLELAGYTWEDIARFKDAKVIT